MAVSLNSSFLNAGTDFGLDMIRQSPANVQLVVSPLSVIFALAMVQVGARGKTKMQINEAISSGASDNEIIDYYSDLAKDVLNASEGVQTKIANAFYLDKRYSIEKDYANMITNKYSARIESLDFEKAKETAKIIDKFVSDTTEGKIENFINERAVKDAFSLIVNAVYFKAKWLNEFAKRSSMNSTFYTSEDKTRKIEFMNEYRKNRLYAEDEDMQVLSLPYRDQSYSFNIFLPKQKFGLESLRKKLSGDKIQELLSKLRSTFVTVSIPKMKIETDFELKKALMAMNITDMFSNEADLSGITKSPPLKVSDAAHRALIEVDEEGTTAAAATHFKLMMKSALSTLEDPILFKADHPFIFILTKGTSPYFMGQFA